MKEEFKDLVVVVTGGASGIGFVTANQFHERGSRVIVLDKNISSVPDYLHSVEVDVTERTSVFQAIESIGEAFGRIDVVVNNAGISSVGTVEEATDADWSKVFDINVFGMARVTAAALPWLRKSVAASVVNVCSIGALNGLPQRAVYSSSKGAVLSLTYSLATDHVSEGIRVNCVSPGTVSSPFVEKMLLNFPDPEAERAALNARQATNRMVTPEEVAGAILYLASPLSGSTTGTALEVDGGVTHLRVRR